MALHCLVENVNTCSVRYNFTVSKFMAGIVDVTAVVRQYCCNTVILFYVLVVYDFV